jgi:hypothetical protein
MDEVSTVDLIETDAAKIIEMDEGEWKQRDRLEQQGRLRDDWVAVKRRSKSFIVVDTDEYAWQVLEAFHHNPSREVAFDTEGVKLSRTGKMTVITLCLCDPCSIAFVFDLEALGSSIGGGTYSLKSLLESETIKKISFDCRTDSDALFHQFNVTLTNCLDLQVFQLGIKIQNGKYVVGEDNGPQHEYVKGMHFISGGYLTRGEIADRNAAPPCHDEWGNRPLLDVHWQYAANDVHTIKRLLQGMRSLVLAAGLYGRIDEGSRRYTEVFREREEAVEDLEDKCRVVPI